MADRRPVVLVVEDEPQPRGFLAFLLEKVDCEAHIPQTGEELEQEVTDLLASAEAGEPAIDVLVLDGQLREWGSNWSDWQEEFLLLLGGRGLVVAISGIPDIVDQMDQFFEGRCEGFAPLSKPFGARVFIDLISMHLAKER